MRPAAEVTAAGVRGLLSHSFGRGDDALRELRLLMTLAESHVAVATAQAPDGRLAAVPCEQLQVVWEPARRITWSLSSGSDSLPVFAQASHFAVNLLGAESAARHRRFAEPGSDKFAQIDFEFGQGGAPLLEAAVATLECECESHRDRDGSTLVVGRPIKVRTAANPSFSSGDNQDV